MALQSGHVNDALELLDKANRESDNHSRALYWLVVAEHENLRFVIRYFPEANPKTHISLALIYKDRGTETESIGCIEEGLADISERSIADAVPSAELRR